MSDNPSSPLLGNIDNERSRPESCTSQKSSNSKRSNDSEDSKGSLGANRSVHSEESTPLLSRDIDYREYGDRPPPEDDQTSAAASSLKSIQDGPSQKGGRRWPTILALTLLCLVIITILVLGFVTPAVVQEYAKEAVIFEPTDLSIDSFTASGVKARVQGDFTLDASRVHKKPVRDLGRFGTWIVKAVESKRTKVKVYMPEYGDVLLGVADVPRIVVDVRNGHTTRVDFLSELVAGDIDGIRRIASDWLDGRLGQLRVQGLADVELKSGIFNLGTQRISESVVFKSHDLPKIPHYVITKLNFYEVELPESSRGMAADVSLTVTNDFPVTFTVPPLKFNILTRDCSPEQPYILLADATTAEIEVKPKQDVHVDVGGVIRELPNTLITACPDTKKSPLDLLLGGYINGDETILYVQGSDSSSFDTPEWITKLLSSIIVPLPFPGHTFDGLIRDFSLADVHFGLPDPFAAPDSPKSQPRLSATVKALINLPKEMNFPINVGRVRADADVYYHKEKLGTLNLRKWQKANSTRIEPDGETSAGLAIASIVRNAPLNVTDDGVFADLVEALIFGGKAVVLDVQAQVDVETETALGKFIVRDLPAQGKVFVKPISSGNISSLNLQVGSLMISDTTESTMTFKAKLNITNPTEYSATVPYMNIKLLSNGSILGHATTRDISIVPGPNYNIPVTSLWDPVGEKGAQVGIELVSQYISGFNTSLTLQTHADTIPTHPNLGKALSAFPISIPTPKLPIPPNPNHPDDTPDPNAPRFIDDVIMHLLSSTCTLTLLSPLHQPLYVTSLNATAIHHAEPVGSILYDLPFVVPPGASMSPRLPVNWSLDSVGFKDVVAALGGKLKVDAQAIVGVRVGKWEARVRYVGRGVGAGVRL